MAGYGIEQNFDLPVPGVDTDAIGAAKLNVILQSLDSTLSAKVTPAGMDINANLSLRSGATYSALTDASKLALRPATALDPVAHPAAIYVNADGELCYNDSDGNDVVITTAGSVAGAAGNIGTTGSPAYATSSVQILWDASKGYEFLGDAGVYSTALLDTLKLVDGSYAISITAPTLATDYTLTLPAAVPASTSVVLMAASGALSLTRDLSIDTLIAGGLITASAGLTAAVDQHVTVSGSGKFKHATRVRQISPISGDGQGTVNIGTGAVAFLGSAGDDHLFPVDMDVGQSISSISVYMDPGGTGSKTLAFKSINESGTVTTIATRTLTSSSTSDYDITAGAGTGWPCVIEADKSYFVAVSCGDFNDIVRLISVYYDQP